MGKFYGVLCFDILLPKFSILHVAICNGLSTAFVDSSPSPFMLDSSPSPSPHNFCNVESCWLGLESESEYNILLKNESKRILFSVPRVRVLELVYNQFLASSKPVLNSPV